MVPGHRKAGVVYWLFKKRANSKSKYYAGFLNSLIQNIGGMRHALWKKIMLLLLPVVLFGKT